MNEETDSLEPELTQTLVTMPGTGFRCAERYAAGDVCRARRAARHRVLGTYAEGFYAGSPALTRQRLRGEHRLLTRPRACRSSFSATSTGRS